MTYVFFWVFFSIIVGVFAGNRGRSGAGWFVLSLLISPLITFLLVAVSKNLDPARQISQPSTATHRKCPACAELILPEAVVCKHCGSKVEADTSYAQRRVTAAKMAEASSQAKIIVTLLVIIGIMVVVAAKH